MQSRSMFRMLIGYEGNITKLSQALVALGCNNPINSGGWKQLIEDKNNKDKDIWVSTGNDLIKYAQVFFDVLEMPGTNMDIKIDCKVRVTNVEMLWCEDWSRDTPEYIFE